MSVVRLVGGLTGLREFSDADESAFVSQANFPEMFEFMKFRYATQQAAADGFAWLMDLQRQSGPQSKRFWAIETARDRIFVGWAGIEIGPHGHGDEVGWFLLPPYWGRGYATDATAVLLGYAFDELGSRRIVATCDPENIGSRRVLEKSGMTSEGLLAEPVETWRGPRSRLLYATATVPSPQQATGASNPLR